MSDENMVNPNRDDIFQHMNTHHFSDFCGVPGFGNKLKTGIKLVRIHFLSEFIRNFEAQFGKILRTPSLITGSYKNKCN